MSELMDKAVIVNRLIGDLIIARPGTDKDFIAIAQKLDDAMTELLNAINEH